MTKIYTEEPKRNPARKAWRYFKRRGKGRSIREMYYSPMCDTTPHCWVCDYGFTGGYFGSAHEWDQICSSTLRDCVDDDGVADWEQPGANGEAMK